MVTLMYYEMCTPFFFLKDVLFKFFYLFTGNLGPSDSDCIGLSENLYFLFLATLSSMWKAYLPDQGLIEPRPPAVEGRVLTTGPPGKSHVCSFLSCITKVMYDLLSQE